MFMKLRTLFVAGVVLAFALTLNANVAAQAGVVVSGRLLNSLTG
jgi:hypothetical protein